MPSDLTGLYTVRLLDRETNKLDFKKIGDRVRQIEEQIGETSMSSR